MASSDHNDRSPNTQQNAAAVPTHTGALERKAGRFSLIWVVPFIALIICGILLWNSKLNNGPTITITTNSAQGIEEGKTLVKMRSVNVGVVTDVAIASNYQNIVLTVQMDKGTDDMLRADTQFWVVKPRIENTGVSGLDTLLSGSYIELFMGSDSDYARSFTALDEPPVRQSGEHGIMLNLISDDSRKLGAGDVVTFRGFDVGAITEAYLDVETQLVKYVMLSSLPPIPPSGLAPGLSSTLALRASRFTPIPLITSSSAAFPLITSSRRMLKTPLRRWLTGAPIPSTPSARTRA